MFGHHESAQAKVLFAEMVISAWEEEHHTTYEFVLEVQPPNGQAFRAKTKHSFPSFTPHPEVGDVVYVKYDPKSLSTELHLHGDNRYGWEGEKHKEQVQRQAEQARRDALLSAPPGTPLSSATPRGHGGRANLDPELQALMDLEELERQEQARGGQQWNVQAPGGFPGMGAQVDPQAMQALGQAQMLHHELERSGASGRATILRMQQTGAPIKHYTPFFVEVQVQPDGPGYPFQVSFTTWIDTNRGTLMEGYTLPVKYDAQHTARMMFLFP